MAELRMTITQDAQGNIKVDCPVLGNKGLCYMLLENARDAIKDFHDKAAAAEASSRISLVPASALPPNGRG